MCRVLPLREDLCRDRGLMAANDYRAYLRNHIDMEEAPGRAAHTGSTHRALIFGTLAVMGLLQVASSVAILLHLTGYLREVSNSQGSEDRRHAPGGKQFMNSFITTLFKVTVTIQVHES